MFAASLRKKMATRCLVRAPARDFRAAVVFHGSGVYDGTETTEAVSLLVGLSRIGADVQVFAPDRPQAHVVNHTTGEEQENPRNVLEESARIARGNIKALSELSAQDYDALLIPGGFGAAKNLSTFGFDGADMTVHDDIEQTLRDFHSAKKVIGLTCISPIIAAKIFGAEGVKLTLGGRGDSFPYAGSIDAAASFGAEMHEMDVRGICTDWKNKIISTPSYMQGDASPHQIFDGIQNFLTRVNSLVRQQVVSQEKAAQTDTVTSDSQELVNETIMMRRLVEESVNRLWSQHCNSSDGTLSYEEAQNLINDTFGGLEKQMSKETYDQIWKKVDRDDDMRISKKELSIFLISLSKF